MYRNNRNFDNINLKKNHYRNFDKNHYRFDFHKFKGCLKRLSKLNINDGLKMNKCNFYSDLRKIKI